MTVPIIIETLVSGRYDSKKHNQIHSAKEEQMRLLVVLKTIALEGFGCAVFLLLRTMNARSRVVVVVEEEVLVVVVTAVVGVVVVVVV